MSDEFWVKHQWDDDEFACLFSDWLGCEVAVCDVVQDDDTEVRSLCVGDIQIPLTQLVELLERRGGK